MANGRDSEEVQRFHATRIKAEQGDDWAQNDLGEMYYFSKGGLQNYEEAAKWFRKAAENGWREGNIRAQWYLGVDVF